MSDKKTFIIEQGLFSLSLEIKHPDMVAMLHNSPRHIQAIEELLPIVIRSTLVDIGLGREKWMELYLLHTERLSDNAQEIAHRLILKEKQREETK